MSNTEPLFAFFGTSQFVTHSLDALEHHGYLPALVITAPDKPRGRGLSSSPTPVKRWALERDIDVITPENLKDPGLVAELANTPWDLFIVASYNKMLPKAVLDIPRRHCLNIHPSLLPKFRGPSPFISAILADGRETGVTIMQMGEQMDAGPIVAQARIEIAAEDWPPPSTLLSEMLFTEGGNLLAEVLESWLSGEIEPELQDETRATYTKKFADADALIELTDNPRQNFLKVRAFDANPRAYFLTPNNKRVIITEAKYTEDRLEILRVIPEGKKEMAYADFLRGQR
jgi:methionyl-tRNA formyltransferase